MSKLKTLFGFDIEIEEIAYCTLEDYRWSSLRKHLANLDSKECHLYLHSVSLSNIGRSHFGIKELSKRVEHLSLSLVINDNMQKKSRTFPESRMRFLNHLADDVYLGPDAEHAKCEVSPFRIAAKIPFSFFQLIRSNFRIQAFTFVSAGVRQKDRKITALVFPHETEEYSERLYTDFGDPTRRSASMKTPVVLLEPRNFSSSEERADPKYSQKTPAIADRRGDSMPSGFEDFLNEEIVLVKKDGAQHKARASVQSTRILVLDERFPVAAGDEIFHVLPSGVKQQFEVLDPGFVRGPDGDSHYDISVRGKHGAHSPLHTSVVNNYHYTNSGIAAVVGSGIASNNVINMESRRETFNFGDPRIEEELTRVRKTLADDADDDDSVIEIGNIATAQRALKAQNEGGFKSAIRQIGAKAWAVAERLGLEWMTTQGRDLLNLPPGQ